MPFLGEGYGKEFDAWSNALNAKILATTGVYEVSRLPGHPLYELFLAALWPYNHGYWIFNFWSALASAGAVYFFYSIAKQLQVQGAFYLALAFGFVPTFFIAGTYLIDYNFALFFILVAFDQLLKGRWWLVGLMIAMATGFRISSFAFLLPFALWIGWRNYGAWLSMGLTAGFASLLFYAPPLSTYGIAFLDFHKPPFPGWASVLYKLSFGIWGLPLLLGLPFLAVKSLGRKPHWRIPKTFGKLPFGRFLGLIIALQLAVFARLPFKSEFFIPAIPFLLLFVGAYLSEKEQRWLAYLSLSSLLFLGFDYQDPYRGASPAAGSFSFQAGGKEIFCSPIQGPLSIDQSKRRNKSETVTMAINQLKEADSAWVVCGWYWPELVLKAELEQHHFDYYSTQSELDSVVASGRQILYLPEIGQQNVIINPNSRLFELGKPLLP